jgi:hypothetical protein
MGETEKTHAGTSTDNSAANVQTGKMGETEKTPTGGPKGC